MSPKAHARVDDNHFEIVGPTFANTVGEFRKLLSSVRIAFTFETLAEVFTYKLSLVITEAVCCDIFESFRNGGKAKITRRVVCKLVSTRLYCAYAPADVVPLSRNDKDIREQKRRRKTFTNRIPFRDNKALIKKIE